MESEGDVHYCLRCNTEIKGLMAYVEHRQSQCPAAEQHSQDGNISNEDGVVCRIKEEIDEDDAVVEIDGEILALNPDSPKKRGRKRKATSPVLSPQTPDLQPARERPGDSPRRSGRRGIRISYADLVAGIDRNEARMSDDDGKLKDTKANSAKAKNSRTKETPAKVMKIKDVTTNDSKSPIHSPRKVGRPLKKAPKMEEITDKEEASRSMAQSENEAALEKETASEMQTATVKETASENKIASEKERKSNEKKKATQKLGQKIKLRALKEKSQKALKNRRKLQAAAEKKLGKKGTKEKKKDDGDQGDEGEAEDVAKINGGNEWQEDVNVMAERKETINPEAVILIKDKKFYCTVCRIFCSSKKKIDVHCRTNKHMKRCKPGWEPPPEDEKKQSATDADENQIILECTLCSYRTKNEGHYARHLSSISHAKKTEMELFGCDKCHRKYKTEEELLEHQKFHTIPRCAKCKEEFETEELLEAHQEEQGHKVEHRCPECDKTFSNKGNLRNHMRIHNPDCKYHCDMCQYSCVQWADMKKHKYRHMGFKPFKCGLCDMESLTKHAMERHMRTHLIRTKDYKCDICGKGYCEEYLMKQHKYMKHRLERRYPCDFEGCTYAFKFKSSLLIHQRMHTQEKPYLCEDCGYKSSTKYGLTKHIRLHTGEKPFVCDFPNCNYRCRLSTHLSRHKIIHTGVKPYHCPFCSYSCNNKQNLRKHLLNTKSHSGLKMYKCKSCPDYTTNVFRDYVYHIRQNHAEDDKYISFFEVAESVTKKNEHMAEAFKNEDNIATEMIETEEIVAEEDLDSFSVVTVVPGKKGNKKRSIAVMDDRAEVQKKLEQVILALEDHSAEVEAKAAEEATAGNAPQETEHGTPVHANSLSDLVSLAAKEFALGKEGETIVLVPEVPEAENETEVCTTEAGETVVATTTGEDGEGITQFVVEFDQQGRLITEEDLAAATWLHNMGNIQDVTVEIQESPAVEQSQQ